MDKAQKILNELDFSNSENLYQINNICRALSVPERLEIIRLLMNKSITMTEIAKKLNLPLSSTVNHVKILEEAEIVFTEKFRTRNGQAKICFLNSFSILINFLPNEDDKQLKYVESMPVGLFSDCRVGEFNGLSSASNIIGVPNDKQSFFIPEHVQAEIVWMNEGWIEYSFPKRFDDGKRLDEIKFSFEICSESPNYRLDYPSELTVWVNGVEILTFISPGDFGGRKGKFSPDWWPQISTQYGLLTSVAIRRNGAYLNERLVNRDICLGDLRFAENQCVRFRVGNKDDCRLKGGFNLFGKSFGDYNQDILMEVVLR